MGVRTGNPEWKNSPDQSTPITASKLNAIEREVDSAHTRAMTPGPAGPPGAPGAPGAAGAAATTPVYTSFAALPNPGVSNRLYTVLPE